MLTVRAALVYLALPYAVMAFSLSSAPSAARSNMPSAPASAFLDLLVTGSYLCG